MIIVNSGRPHKQPPTDRQTSPLGQTVFTMLCNQRLPQLNVVS